jgi:hypothetical protein
LLIIVITANILIMDIIISSSPYHHWHHHQHHWNYWHHHIITILSLVSSSSLLTVLISLTSLRSLTSTYHWVNRIIMVASSSPSLTLPSSVENYIYIYNKAKTLINIIIIASSSTSSSSFEWYCNQWTECLSSIFALGCASVWIMLVMNQMMHWKPYKKYKDYIRIPLHWFWEDAINI